MLSEYSSRGDLGIIEERKKPQISSRIFLTVQIDKFKSGNELFK